VAKIMLVLWGGVHSTFIHLDFIDYA